MERPDLYPQDPDRSHISDLGEDQSVSGTAVVTPEIDVDRLIWDPDYRTWVKEKMKKTA